MCLFNYPGVHLLVFSVFFLVAFLDKKETSVKKLFQMFCLITLMSTGSYEFNQLANQIHALYYYCNNRKTNIFKSN